MMEPRLTIKDIARISGVGISTVSRVVNNRPDVSEDTRRRVLDVVNSQGYAPNSNAKHLKQMNSDYIGVVIRGAKNMFLAGIIEQIQRFIDRTKYHFLAHYIDEQDDEIVAALRLYQERKVLGIIFLGGSMTGREDILQNFPVPCVFATVNASEIAFDGIMSVAVDDRKSAKTAVDYLFDCGHRDIAIVGGQIESRDAIGLRYQGVVDSFEAHGMTFDRAKRYMTSTFSFPESYRAVKNALQRDETFTAIFAMSDIMAIGAAKAVTDAGKRVPEDISIIGYDGIELASYYQPTLATIRQPQERIAKECVRLISKAIEGETSHVHITLETELMPGASVRRLHSID